MTDAAPAPVPTPEEADTATLNAMSLADLIRADEQRWTTYAEAEQVERIAERRGEGLAEATAAKRAAEAAWLRGRRAAKAAAYEAIREKLPGVDPDKLGRLLA